MKTLWARVWERASSGIRSPPASASMAALAWAFSNVRQIDPQNRAVVLHFGALDRIQDTHAFRAGMFAVEQIQLLNSGKIDMQTYTARIKAFHAEAEVS